MKGYLVGFIPSTPKHPTVRAILAPLSLKYSVPGRRAMWVARKHPRTKSSGILEAWTVPAPHAQIVDLPARRGLRVEKMEEAK